MTKKAGISAIIAGICLVTFFLTREKPSSSPQITEEILSRFNGVDREKLKGNHYLLHFWAKWCEPCTVEIPHLVEFARKVKTQKPFFVLAVSLDPTLEESMEILPGGGKDLPPNFLLALDSDHQVAESLGSYQYPETYLVGPDGKILEKWIGAQPWKKPEVQNYFSEKIR